MRTPIDDGILKLLERHRENRVALQFIAYFMRVVALVFEVLIIGLAIMVFLILPAPLRTLIDIALTTGFLLSAWFVPWRVRQLTLHALKACSSTERAA